MREDERFDTAISRAGAVCAGAGVITTMVAGANFRNLTNTAGTEEVLRTWPMWYWPLIHLAFIAGAFLWVGAFIALAHSMSPGAARAMAWLGVAAVFVGAAVHIVDSSLSGVSLTWVAQRWAHRSTSDQARVLQDADLLLHVMRGTWANVLNFYSGVPFVLCGVAVARTRTYPAWFGGVAVVAGGGSVISGTMMFLGLPFVPGLLSVVLRLQ
jgi:hypothetical protein